MLIRDRDSKFGSVFDRVAQGVAVRVIVRPVKIPNMNAVCERFIGSARRECLDHVHLLGEKQMKSILGEYALSYFNYARPYQDIDQRMPLVNPIEPVPASLDFMFWVGSTTIIELPRD